MNWNSSEFVRLKRRTHQLAEELLDASVNYSQQDSEDLVQIRAKLIKEFPRLGLYVGCWPVNDFLKLYLKASVAKGKRREQNAKATAILRASSRTTRM